MSSIKHYSCIQEHIDLEKNQCKVKIQTYGNVSFRGGCKGHLIPKCVGNNICDVDVVTWADVFVCKVAP